MRQGLSTSDAGKMGAIAAAPTIALQKQQRMEAWNTNPKLCLFCQAPIPYEKRSNEFCSQSCGAKYSNAKRGRKLQVPSGINGSNCLFCSKSFTYKGNAEHKYCSRDCMMAFWWKQTKEELLSVGIDNSYANTTGKKYLTELHEGKCQICLKSEWQGQPMPLVLDHINGNPYDNSLLNLRVICHNCNAQTPTFAGRNKGNGRFERARRYKLEKEVISAVKADVV